jgi:hypothetical protein
MTIAMQPIYTQTASGSASAITFNNIPQTFTDLMVVASTRSGGSAIDVNLFVRLNGDASSSNYSMTRIYGLGSSTASDRNSSVSYAQSGNGNGASSTASTYSNNNFYIPNYTGSNFKSWTGDAVIENNATSAVQMFTASLWRNTAAITSLQVGDFGGNNFVNASTFTLYGITKG